MEDMQELRNQIEIDEYEYDLKPDTTVTVENGEEICVVHFSKTDRFASDIFKRLDISGETTWGEVKKCLGL